MADEPDAEKTDDAKPPKKKGGLLVPLLLGLNLALMLGGGAAFAIMSGAFAPPPIVADLLGVAPESEDGEEGEGEEGGEGDAAEDAYEDGTSVPDLGEVAFVELDQLTVTLTRSGARRQLRVMIVIETAPTHAPAVEALRPRIYDALNTLLRAIDEDDLADPAAFDRLRAQLLRRVRISVDPALVRDLLITEYVIF